MIDIVPKLQKKINSEFDKRLESSQKLKGCMKKLETEKATSRDTFDYSSELGRIASEVLTDVMTEDALPNGSMYFNIADRTVKPILVRCFELVMDYAKRQQSIDDRKNGIGIKPSVPEFPEARINDLMIKFADIFDEETYNV